MNDLSRREITSWVIKTLGLKSNKPIDFNSKQVMVHCPLHLHDHTPSCGISFERGQYHCFACGRSGNVESLYKDVSGRDIYKDLDIKTDPFSSFSRSFNTYSFKEDFTLKTSSIEFDRGKTTNPLYNEECSSYLKKRGIRKSEIEKADMMYSEALYINGTFFKKRLLIPIYEDGKLISIEGRRIEDSNEPKVLYPKGSSVNTLYDIDNLDRHNTLYIVEGLMDCFVLRSCKEFANSTSIFGAQLTKRQIHLLEDFDSICLIPDLDEAGLSPLKKLKEIDNGQIFYLRLPSDLNGVHIKDVGDLPKANMTPEDLINKKWMSYIKPLSSLKL